ncbi:hypothetical protein GE061_004718 [Apolygus lucorum]|uniref:C2H2-type domain-containing protein n=1 Tax=Apolygus lucorum TaxID=248454 RepID=A0A8S9WZH6_APOLU|nr:hypothetical protein GE061_004718 [Apolygus lucorum]
MTQDENVVEIGGVDGVFIMFKEDGLIIQEFNMSVVDEHEVTPGDSVSLEYSTSNLKVETNGDSLPPVCSPPNVEIETVCESISSVGSPPNVQIETAYEPVSPPNSPLNLVVSKAEPVLPVYDSSIPQVEIVDEPLSSDYSSINPEVATVCGIVSPVCSLSNLQVPTAPNVPQFTDAVDRDLRRSFSVQENLPYQEINDHKDGPSRKSKSFDDLARYLDDRSAQRGDMGEMSYTCHSCGYKAPRLGTLRIHMETHTMERTYDHLYLHHGGRLMSVPSEPEIILVEENHTLYGGDDNGAGQKKDVKYEYPEHRNSGLIEDTGKPENTQLDGKLFFCFSCGYKALRLGTLKRHMKTHTFDKPFSGKHSQLGQLSGHKLTRSGENPYASDELYSGVSELAQVKDHMRTHIGKKQCESAQQVHKTSNSILRKGDDGKGYQRSVSDEIETRTKMLTRSGNKARLAHQNSHREEKPFGCDDHLRTHPEEKAYDTKAGPSKSSKRRKIQNKKSFQLKISLRTPSGDKPYPCGSCSFKSRTRRDLKTHEMIHTGDKPYGCSICSYRGRQITHLADHMRTHSSEKPFGCQICDFRTKYQPYLRYHMRIHSGDKPFTCYYCGYKARFRDRIVKHMTIHVTDKLYACDQCDFRTRQGWYLKSHKKIHFAEKPLICAHCDFQTKSKECLKAHLKRHTGEKPYSCDVCDYKARYRVNLTLHVRTHTGEKPYPCSSCSYRGRNSTHLKLHMKNNHPGEKWPVSYDD